jgi:hypothetical protein
VFGIGFMFGRLSCGWLRCVVGNTIGLAVRLGRSVSVFGVVEILESCFELMGCVKNSWVLAVFLCF